jgi:hypothetical protein
VSTNDGMTTEEFKAKLAELRGSRPPGTHLYEAGQTVLCVHCAGVSLLALIVTQDPRPRDGLLYTGGPENYARRLSVREEAEWVACCRDEGWAVCACGVKP